MTFVRPERSVLWADPQPLGDRAAVWVTAFEGVSSMSWELRSGATVTVDDVEASGNAVRFWATVQHPDGRVIYEDDHVVVNPPSLDGEGGAIDVLSAVRALVEEHLP